MPKAASAPQLPSDMQLEEAMKKHRQNMIDQGIAGTKAAPPRIQPVPQGVLKADVPPAPTGPIKREDIGDVVKRYSAGPQASIPPELLVRGDLLIFASFSMPKQVLAELSRQAKEMNAVLVLRGFVGGSADKTKEAAEAVNPTGAGWEIHPELFKTFRIKTVPTFVLASAKSGSLDEEGCAPEATYAAVSGNISLQLALDTIRRKAQPEIARLAEVRVNDLKRLNEQKRLVR